MLVNLSPELIQTLTAAVNVADRVSAVSVFANAAEQLQTAYLQGIEGPIGYYLAENDIALTRRPNTTGMEQTTLTAVILARMAVIDALAALRSAQEAEQAQQAERPPLHNRSTMTGPRGHVIVAPNMDAQ